MKQRIIYIAIAAIAGLGIGYLLFGDAGTSTPRSCSRSRGIVLFAGWT